MSLSDLEDIWPRFGLLPDIALRVCLQHHESLLPPAVYRTPTPPDFFEVHCDDFVRMIAARLSDVLRMPVSLHHDKRGRRVLVVMGWFVFVEQKNGCWRTYVWGWTKDNPIALGRLPESGVIAQHGPWRDAWLQELVVPLAFECRAWHHLAPGRGALERVSRYSRWLLNEVMAPLLQKSGASARIRAELAAALQLDPWTLQMANRMLRAPQMPVCATLEDYNRVRRRGREFRRMEVDAPHLVPLYAGLCIASGFLRRGEPVQRLKLFLLANGVKPRTWAVITQTPARFWLLMRDFYSSVTPGAVLDFVKCLDLLSFNREFRPWIISAVMSAYGGPASRYDEYARHVETRAKIWRHIVRLLEGVSATDALQYQLSRTVAWTTAADVEILGRDQRRAGWPWLVKSAQAWDEKRSAVLRAQARHWPVPLRPQAVAEYTFEPMSDAEAVWDEGRIMRHCAGDYIDRCAGGEMVLLSVKTSGARVATMQLRCGPDGWRVAQLAGKANMGVSVKIWRAARLYLDFVQRRAM